MADPIKAAKSIPGYLAYWRDWIHYARLHGSEAIRVVDTYPRLHDKTPITPFDSHYFYQDIWAFKKIKSPEFNGMLMLDRGLTSSGS